MLDLELALRIWLSCTRSLPVIAKGILSIVDHLDIWQVGLSWVSASCDVRYDRCNPISRLISASSCFALGVLVVIIAAHEIRYQTSNRNGRLRNSKVSHESGIQSVDLLAVRFST